MPSDDASGWPSNSNVIEFVDGTEMFWGGIAVSVFVLVHSFLIHGSKYHLVRILTELVAISVLSESALFLSCYSPSSCTSLKQAVLYDFFGNAVFGLVCQACDNYLTYYRYDIVCGGTTRRHKIFAFSYCLVTLYLSWWPFFTIFPFFFNMNDPEWIDAQLIVSTWLEYAAYILYDLVYLILLLRKLGETEQAVLVSSSSTAKRHAFRMRLLAWRAVMHTFCSIVGISLYCFTFPDGILWQNFVLVVSIHVFLNWHTSDRAIMRLYHRWRRYLRRRYMPASAVDTPKDDSTSISMSRTANLAGAGVALAAARSKALAATSTDPGTTDGAADEGADADEAFAYLHEGRDWLGDLRNRGWIKVVFRPGAGGGRAARRADSQLSSSDGQSSDRAGNKPRSRVAAEIGDAGSSTHSLLPERTESEHEAPLVLHVRPSVSKLAAAAAAATLSAVVAVTAPAAASAAGAVPAAATAAEDRPQQP